MQQPIEPFSRTLSRSSQSMRAKDGSSLRCHQPKPPFTPPKRAPGKSSTSCATTSKPRSRHSKRKASTVQRSRRLAGVPLLKSPSPAAARLASTNRSIPSPFRRPDRKAQPSKLAIPYVQIRHHPPEDPPAYPLPDTLPLARPRLYDAHPARQLRRPHQLHHPLHRRLDPLHSLRISRHYPRPPALPKDCVAHPLPPHARPLRLLLRNPPSSDLHLPLLRIRRRHRPQRSSHRTSR